MAERRPLVQIAGEVQELPSGDSLPGGSGTANVWLSGAGSPNGSANAVTVGDLYLDTATGDVYQATSTGTMGWSLLLNIDGTDGDDGDDGVNGNIWFVQNLVDATALTTGDLLLQIDSGNVYQASAPGAGNWGSPVMNLKGPQGDQGESGTTTFDAILDAVAEGAINNGTYGQVWNWSSGVSQALALQVNSNTLFNVGYDGASFETYAGLHAQHVFIGTSGGKLSFFSEAGATRQMVSAASTGVGDGAIAALTFSSTPTQAECEALRDQCEYLRDWIEEVRTRLNELNFALDAYGLIENGI